MALSARIASFAIRLAGEFRKISPVSPTLTRVGDVLTRIDYTNGDHKIFSYSSGVLSRIDHVIGPRTVRKDFTYTAGLLTNILESEL